MLLPSRTTSSRARPSDRGKPIHLAKSITWPPEEARARRATDAPARLRRSGRRAREGLADRRECPEIIEIDVPALGKADETFRTLDEREKPLSERNGDDVIPPAMHDEDGSRHAPDP